MKDKIILLENSLRTNIAMARAMTSLMKFELARRYLASAQNDKRLLGFYKAKYNEDTTMIYTTI